MTIRWLRWDRKRHCWLGGTQIKQMENEIRWYSYKWMNHSPSSDCHWLWLPDGILCLGHIASCFKSHLHAQTTLHFFFLPPNTAGYFHENLAYAPHGPYISPTNFQATNYFVCDHRTTLVILWAIQSPKKIIAHLILAVHLTISFLFKKIG